MLAWGGDSGFTMRSLLDVASRLWRLPFSCTLTIFWLYIDQHCGDNSLESLKFFDVSFLYLLFWFKSPTQKERKK